MYEPPMKPTVGAWDPREAKAWGVGGGGFEPPAFGL